MKRIAGFTLIELMVTLLILGVVAGMAAPAMQNMLKSNKQTTRINQLAGLLNYARSEAVGQSTVVSICASSNATACNTSSWELGGLIFRGDAATGTPAAEDILKFLEPQTSDATLRRASDKHPVSMDFSDVYLRYDASGRLFATDSGSFVLCDDRGENEAKALLINNIGQTRNAVDSDDDGIIEIIIANNPTAVECP